MTRSPPISSRKDAFVNEVKRRAGDDSYGYSQKPPSGRWGPDYDCSSLVYDAANSAGYKVGSGGDKVRFTGTMLKDFEKAGFQILPFANVGISDLKIGDILLNLALHAEVYVGDGKTVGANSSEDGGYVGEAGDQTGHEIDEHPVLTFDKGWDWVLRPPDDSTDNAEYDEEGDISMPMNYMQPNTGWPQANMPMNNYPMNNGMNSGYPQGNLGQMNGYSQANANMRMPNQMPNQQMPMNGGWQQGYQQGYPQGQSQSQDLTFVMGIEGAKNVNGAPNSRMALFDEDKPLMYICSYDQNGMCNGVNVYCFEECSEEMPQHLSPLMKNNMHGNQMQMPENFVTREEFNQLKEMLENGKPSTPANESKSNGVRSPRTN